MAGRNEKHTVDYFGFHFQEGKVTRKSNRPKITVWDREKIFLKSQGKCVDCGALCAGGWIYHKPSVFHFNLNNTHEIHHIIPVISGGSNGIENLILLCIPCHLERHKIIKEGG